MKSTLYLPLKSPSPSSRWGRGLLCRHTDSGRPALQPPKGGSCPPKPSCVTRMLHKVLAGWSEARERSSLKLGRWGTKKPYGLPNKCLQSPHSFFDELESFHQHCLAIRQAVCLAVRRELLPHCCKQKTSVENSQTGSFGGRGGNPHCLLILPYACLARKEVL